MPRVYYFVKITPNKDLFNYFDQKTHPLHYDVFFHLVQLSHCDGGYLVMPMEKWQELQHGCNPHNRDIADPLCLWDSYNLEITTFAHLLV